jgi:hypothetical protein
MPSSSLLAALIKHSDADKAASNSADASLDFGLSSSFDSAQVPTMVGWLVEWQPMNCALSLMAPLRFDSRFRVVAGVVVYCFYVLFDPFEGGQ